MSRNITFDSYNLNNGTDYVIYDYSVDNSAPKEYADFDLARMSGNEIVSSKYIEKIATIYGYVLGSNRDELEYKMDNLKYYLSGANKNLDIEKAYSTRRYVANLKGEVDFDKLQVTYVKFRADFIIKNGYGADTSTNTSTKSGITSSTDSGTLSIGGTFPAKPIITITLNSGTGLTTDKYIQFRNTDSGERVKITRDWTAGDVVIINAENNLVTVNGSNVEFTGNVPDEFAPNTTANWDYEDDFTTRDVDISITWTNLWL